MKPTAPTLDFNDDDDGDEVDSNNPRNILMMKILISILFHGMNYELQRYTAPTLDEDSSIFENILTRERFEMKMYTCSARQSH